MSGCEARRSWKKSMSASNAARPRTVVRPARPVLPPVPVGPIAVGDQEPEEEVKTASRLPEGIAFDVEDHVARRRPREALKAALVLGWQRTPFQLAGRAARELERGLLVQRLERMWLVSCWPKKARSMRSPISRTCAAKVVRSSTSGLRIRGTSKPGHER